MSTCMAALYAVAVVSTDILLQWAYSTIYACACTVPMYFLQIAMSLGGAVYLQNLPEP